MKLFVPLLDNGNGDVKRSFMAAFWKGFQGLDVELQEASDSHANRGMNKVANDFLASDCEAWINLDADILFRPKDVQNLLSHEDLLLVYGIYPKKEDATNPCIGTFSDVQQTADQDLVHVRRCGRGFMMVKRALLEMMKEDNKGPALRYHNHGRVEWDFFPSGVVTGAMSFYGSTESNPRVIAEPLDEDGYPKREWISEDWYFCERARALGVKTLIDSRIALGHIGQKVYLFNSEQAARTDSDITDYRQIYGWMDYENFYRDLARALVKNVLTHGSARFVEVGTFLGRSMGAMNQFLSDYSNEVHGVKAHDVELHAVDTFSGGTDGVHNKMEQLYLNVHGGNLEKTFRANMAALKVPVIVHAKPSVEAAKDFADASCDVIFIDGDHSEPAVKADIISWLPKVKPGGVLCGHDIDEPGVANAVNACFDGSVMDAMGRALSDIFVGNKIRVQVLGRCWYVKLPAPILNAAIEPISIDRETNETIA